MLLATTNNTPRVFDSTKTATDPLVPRRREVKATQQDLYLNKKKAFEQHDVGKLLSWRDRVFDDIHQDRD